MQTVLHISYHKGNGFRHYSVFFIQLFFIFTYVEINTVSTVYEKHHIRPRFAGKLENVDLRENRVKNPKIRTRKSQSALVKNQYAELYMARFTATFIESLHSAAVTLHSIA